MPLTLQETKERLTSIDEVDLIEYLGITSIDIVERFDDIIEDKLDELREVVAW